MSGSGRRSVLIALVSLIIVVAIASRPGAPSRAAEAPAPGGVYVEGVVGHPTYLNPLLSAFNDADQDVVALVFSGLTRLAPDGTIAPDLASDWTISPDQKTYTFHLRPAVWQDGQPVTADDVVFTINQIQSPSFPGSPEIARLWQSIHLTAVDSRTVQFTLGEPYAPFLEYTTLGILPAHLLGGTSGRALLTTPFNAHPVGTGPFQVTSASLQEVRLIANPSYHGPHPYLAGITFRYYDSVDAAIEALRRGEIQGLGNLPPDRALELASDPRLNLVQEPEYAKLNLLILNTQNPLFADTTVRRALDLAIDRSQVIATAAGGEGVAAAGPIMPESWAFVAHPEAYRYDPGEAARLLDQAGWALGAPSGIRQKNGRPFRFVLLVINERARVRMAQEISRQLRALGVEADVQTAGWSGIVQDFLAPHRFDAVLGEIYSPTPDPDPYPFWHSSQINGGLNVAGWSSQVADQLLEKGRREEDRTARQAAYAEFQRLFAEEQPSILLYYPVYLYALSPSLKGVRLGLMTQPADRFQTVTGWYLHSRG